MPLVNFLLASVCAVKRGDVVFDITSSPELAHTGVVLYDVALCNRRLRIAVAHATFKGVRVADWERSKGSNMPSIDLRGWHPKVDEGLRDLIVLLARKVVDATLSLLPEKCCYSLEASIDEVCEDPTNLNTMVITEYRFSCSTFANWCYQRLSIDRDLEIVKSDACPLDASHLCNPHLQPYGPPHLIKRLFPGYLMRAFEIDEYPFDAGPDPADWMAWQAFDRFLPGTGFTRRT